jgi:hypothetical protein
VALAAPAFVIVTVCAALGWPTATLPKARLLEENVSVATPVPESEQEPVPVGPAIEPVNGPVAVGLKLSVTLAPPPAGTVAGLGLIEKGADGPVMVAVFHVSGFEIVIWDVAVW